MSNLPIQQGGLRVLSGIVPASSASTYGTHYSYLGVGGYIEVPTIDDRNSIPVDSNMNDEGYSTGRRRYGMLVYVIDEDKLYRLFPFSGGSAVSLETFTGTSELNQVTMLSDNDGWTVVPDLSVLITGGTYFSGNSSIVLYDSTGGTVSITGITTTDVVDPGDGRVLVATGDSVNTFVAQSDMVFKNSTLSITGDTFMSTTGGTKHPSAILHLDSKTKGLLFPVLTTVEKEAISNPTSGLTVYDSTLEDLSVYTSSGWTGVIAERDNLQKVTERGNSTNRGLIVSGTTYIVGTGTTSGSTAFSVQNSTGGTLLNLFSNGNLNIDNGVLYVDGDNGRVGIGTTTPTAPLEIVQTQLGDGSLNGFFVRDSSNIQANFAIKGGTGASSPRIMVSSLSDSLGGGIGGTGLIVSYVDNSNFYPLRFLASRVDFETTSSSYGSRTTIMRANPSGVLIGTTTDAGYKLDVNGTLRSVNDSYFATTSGNVGIGTTSAAQKLHVVGNILSSDSTGYGFYTARYNNHLTQNAYYTGNTWYSYGSSGTYGSAILFQTDGQNGKALNILVDTTINGANESLSFTSVMQVKTNGNVLIGDNATDVGYKLDVSGTTRVVSTGSTSGSTTLTIQNSTGETTTQFRSDGVIGISSATTYTTQGTVVISATSQNSGIAIVPNGTGAITAQVPNGTVAGGNARGANAVDLQMSRNSAVQVAARDYSVIVGGERNTVGGVSSAKFSSILGGSTNTVLGSFDGILGGNQNTTNSSGSYNAIGGGFFNRILTPAAYANILGGNSNNVSSNYSTVSGGQSNVASTGTHATVIGGLSNTASGQYSISGGRGNTASGLGAIAIGGGFGSSSAIASGSESFAMGQNAQANNINSFAFGLGQKAYLHHGFSHGFTRFGTGNGQYQNTTVEVQDTLTSGGTSNLLKDSAYPLQGSGLIPDGNNRAWNVVINTITVCTIVSGGTLTVGDAHAGEYKFLFKRVGGTSTISPITTSSEVADTSMGTASYSFSAGTSQELAIVFNAPNTANNSTFRAVAKVALTEVAW